MHSRAAVPSEPQLPSEQCKHWDWSSHRSGSDKRGTEIDRASVICCPPPRPREGQQLTSGQPAKAESELHLAPTALSAQQTLCGTLFSLFKGTRKGNSRLFLQPPQPSRTGQPRPTYLLEPLWSVHSHQGACNLVRASRAAAPDGPGLTPGYGRPPSQTTRIP